jgi:hypothetical protein
MENVKGDLMPYNNGKDWDNHDPSQNDKKSTEDEKSYLNKDAPCTCTESGVEAEWKWDGYCWTCANCGDPNE